MPPQQPTSAASMPMALGGMRVKGQKGERGGRGEEEGEGEDGQKSFFFRLLLLRSPSPCSRALWNARVRRCSRGESCCDADAATAVKVAVLRTGQPRTASQMCEIDDEKVDKPRLCSLWLLGGLTRALWRMALPTKKIADGRGPRHEDMKMTLTVSSEPRPRRPSRRAGVHFLCYATRRRQSA